MTRNANFKGETVLWPTTTGVTSNFTTLKEGLDCDVAIVGGGFTGLRSAMILAEAGVSVALFEAGEIGAGASGRCGGQVNPMLPIGKPIDLMRAVGRGCFERLAKATLESASELFAMVAKYEIRCQARQSGWIRANHCAEIAQESRVNAFAWNRFGAGLEFLSSAAEVQKATGAQGYHSAIRCPSGGAVHPLGLVRGMAKTASALGARIFTNTRVEKMSKANDRHQLTVNNHSVSARHVIVATNAYTDGLLLGLKRSFMPGTSIQVATGPLTPEQIEGILPRNSTISDTRHLPFFARREPNNQLVFGGTGYRHPWGRTRGYGWLLQDIQRVFPALGSVDMQYNWSGKIALTDDQLPHLYETENGVTAGLGYNGRGLAMSLVMGRALVERALGAAPETLPFPITPIKRQKMHMARVLGAGLAVQKLRKQDMQEMGIK